MRLPRLQVSIRRAMAVALLLAVGLAFLGKAIIAARSVAYDGDSTSMLIDQAEAFATCGIPGLICFALAGVACLCRLGVLRAKALNIALVILAIAFGYTVAYLTMVRPADTFYWMQPYPNLPHFRSVPRLAEYRIGGRFARVVFKPIHVLDQFLRPSVWTIPL